MSTEKQKTEEEILRRYFTQSEIYKLERVFTTEFGNFVENNPRLQTLMKIAEKTGEGSHGYDHLIRVARYSYLISKLEGLSGKETELTIAAAFLHDIARDKNTLIDDPSPSARKAEEILRELGYNEDEIKCVTEAILFHSQGTDETKVARVLYDSDKLDFGTARAVLRRIPQFSEESGMPIDVLVKYGLKRAKNIEFKTETGKKLAKAKKEYARRLFPEIFENF